MRLDRREAIRYAPRTQGNLDFAQFAACLEKPGWEWKFDPSDDQAVEYFDCLFEVEDLDEVFREFMVPARGAE